MAESHVVPAGVVLDDLFPQALRADSYGCRVFSCTSDINAVRPGDAFVAVLDESGDGHESAAQAVKRGAAAVICERPVPVGSAPTYQVDDTRVAFGELCQALAGDPSQQMRVIGVAGTHGKTTTIALLESIFAHADVDAAVFSSLRTYDGIGCGPGIGEAIAPTSFAKRLAQAEASGCPVALVELSSRSLIESRIAGVELNSVCFTQVTSGNLELHQTAENYRRAVHRSLGYLSGDGVAIFDTDDAVCCRWLAECPQPSLTYGFGDQAQITAEIVENNLGETVFVLTAGNESAAIRTRIIGEHHVRNCLAAAATALAHGVDLQAIAAGIESCESLPSRMEQVDCGQDFAVYMDAAASAEALRSVLRTARSVASGRVICVVGDMLPTSRHETAAIQSVMHKLADVSVVTETLLHVNEAWALTSYADPKLKVVADRDDALRWAMSAAEQGDVVVVAGSHGKTQFDFGQSAATSDSDVVRELLYAGNETVPVLRLTA